MMVLAPLLRRVLLPSVASLGWVMCCSSCSIEPPLHLPQESVEIVLPLVVGELEVIWDVGVDWHSQWWYGWDSEDVQHWGPLEYPEPTYFEVRRFYQGEQLSSSHQLEEKFTLYGNRFKRRYNFGYHDLLFWSNIDSPDGTQTVLIDESDIDNIVATTTPGSVAYARGSGRGVALKKQPDVFYRGYERDFYVSRNIEDYDYYDEAERAWVMQLRTQLDPVVYIYLLQVVVYNNKGRVTGLADNAALTGLAEGVNLNTGRTLASTSDVTFYMRMKHDLEARGGQRADIMGTKFTTYGLCDMEPWYISRGKEYSGSRSDLANNVMLDLMFNNSSDAVFTYDVTRQIRTQMHGGVITIEIDADTITIPNPGTSAGSGFKPYVEEYGDSVVHEFGI